MAVDLASSSINNFLKGLQVFNQGVEQYQKGVQREESLRARKAQLDIVSMFNQSNDQIIKQRDIALGMAKTDEQKADINKKFSKKINDTILQTSGKLAEMGGDPQLISNLFKMSKLAEPEKEGQSLGDQIAAGIAKGVGIQKGRQTLEQQNLSKQLPEGLQVRQGATISKDDVKKVKDTKEFTLSYIENLDKLDKLIEEHGSEFTGETKGTMSTIQTNLVALAKGEGDLNLGVLTGPDMDVVLGKIPDPTSIKANIATSIPFTNYKKQMRAQIKAAKDELIKKARIRLGATNIVGDIFKQPESRKRIGSGAFTPSK